MNLSSLQTTNIDLGIGRMYGKRLSELDQPYSSRLQKLHADHSTVPTNNSYGQVATNIQVKPGLQFADLHSRKLPGTQGMNETIQDKHKNIKTRCFVASDIFDVAIQGKQKYQKLLLSNAEQPNVFASPVHHLKDQLASLRRSPLTVPINRRNNKSKNTISSLSQKSSPNLEYMAKEYGDALDASSNMKKPQQDGKYQATAGERRKIAREVPSYPSLTNDILKQVQGMKSDKIV